VRLLLDENVEKALLNVFPWRESNLGLRRRHPGLDVVRVVDVGLGGRSDTEILEWAAREGRVVVSRDRATLSAEAARRIEGGKPMPGLILLRRGVGVGRILEDLELLLATARPGELENAILYLPL
jgi:predicted nuclease of predicted toxin-antitoxin system